MVNNRGMTFIEVLIALFIMVTGILGAVAMQSVAKQGSFDAMQRSLASSLAQDIIERMRSNSADAAVLNTYNGTYGGVGLAVPATRCNTPAAICNSAQMVTNDLFEWSQSLRGADAFNGTENRGGLTNARGCITHNTQAVTIIISWEGRTETSDADADSLCGSASDKRRQITLNAFLF